MSRDLQQYGYAATPIIGSIYGLVLALVVVWSGDPFELTTRAEHVFVRGREFPVPSRQDMLTERYKSLPPHYTNQP